MRSSRYKSCSLPVFLFLPFCCSPSLSFPIHYKRIKRCEHSLKLVIHYSFLSRFSLAIICKRLMSSPFALFSSPCRFTRPFLKAEICVGRVSKLRVKGALVPVLFRSKSLQKNTGPDLDQDSSFQIVTSCRRYTS